MFDTESADRPPLFQDAAAVIDADFNRESEGRLLDSALNVAPCPLDLAWIAPQFHILPCFRIFEPKHSAVPFDLHYTGTGLNLFTREVANSTLYHHFTSSNIEFSSFTTSIP